MQMYNPPHPGRVLKDAIESIPMTVSEFSAHVMLSRNTVSRIINGRGSVTAEVSIRLNDAFGQEQPDIWFRMQNEYDFWQASQAKRKKIRPIAA